MKYALFLTALTLPLAAATWAQSPTHDHNMHGMKPTPAKASASTHELMQANTAMHNAMDITYTHDVDVDFLRGMIAHHQGAVDMANVQLKYGKDAQVKRLAQDIIRAQNLEIAWMQNWLAQLEARPLAFSDTPTGSGTWSDTKWTGGYDIWMNER